MLFPILTIVGGLIAASSFFIAKKPNAKQFFDKVAPYQGFLGLGLLALGILWTIRAFPLLENLLRYAPFSGVLTIGALFANIAIGFLLSYGLLNKFLLSKNEQAQEKGARLLQKVVKVQVPLGLCAIAIGGAMFVA